MSGPTAAQAPQGYQPVNQAGADAAFQSGVDTLNTGARALQGSVIPQYGAITQNVASNPYYSTAQAYAGLTSGLAGSTVAPNQFGAGESQFGAGQDMTTLARQILGQDASGIGMGVLSNDLSQAGAIGNSGYLGKAQGILDQANKLAPEVMQALFGVGNSILQTGFDPQGDLYNRNYQQQLDQQNAINAMNGVAGTPYGAGVSGDASRNFNLDWQDRQLGRQTQAASAYGSLAGEGVGAYSGLINTGVSGYGGVLGSATGAETGLQGAGTGAYAGLTGAETGALTSLYGGAGSAYKNASDLQTGGLQTLRTAGQEQNQTFLQQMQAYLDALNGQVSGTNSAYGLTQQGIADQGNYLNIGQTATSNAQNAVAANNQTNQNTIAGIGSLVGTVASFIPW